MKRHVICMFKRGFYHSRGNCSMDAEASIGQFARLTQPLLPSIKKFTWMEEWNTFYSPLESKGVSPGEYKKCLSISLLRVLTCELLFSHFLNPHTNNFCSESPDCAENKNIHNCLQKNFCVKNVKM